MLLKNSGARFTQPIRHRQLQSCSTLSCTIPIAPLLKISKEEDDEEYVDEEDVCRECDDVDDGCEEFSMASFLRMRVHFRSISAA